MGERPSILLMTRPQGASERFVAQLPDAIRDRLTVCISPLIEIVPRTAPVDWGDAAAVIFTSTQAVDVLAGLSDRRDLPAICVGEATARAARERGWVANAQGGNADALVAAMLDAPDPGPVLHVSGAHTRGNIVARLALAGRRARGQAIYDQAEVPFGDDAHGYLQGKAPVIAPVFSPRTARHFARQASVNAPLLLGALSESVAKPLHGLGITPVMIAKSPTAAAMRVVVENLLTRADRVEAGPHGY
jgi:uroporphyrinogen-III synthase